MANTYNSSMPSDPGIILPDPQPPMKWERPDMEQAIRCIRQIHRSGRVLRLWDVASLIHRDIGRTSPARKGITVTAIHENLVDIFNRFESCRQLSCGLDPSLHSHSTARTHPNTVRGAILEKFEWYYEFLAILGKLNTTRLLF